MENILFLIVGLTIGITIGFLIYRHRKPDNLPEEDKKRIEEYPILQEKYRTAEQQKKDLSEELGKKEEILLALREEKSKLETLYITLSEQIKQREEEWKERWQERESELKGLLKKQEDIQQTFREQFENISNAILKAKVEELQGKNIEQIGHILNPLKDNIESFKKDFNDKFLRQYEGQTKLNEHLEQLRKLNQTLSEEAQRLTNALKGDVQKQGAWGELLLDKVLEYSGLREGEEYEKQTTFTNEENQRLKPDVIIHLPENKHLIIDAKVSLKAYEEYINAASDHDKEKYLKAHITSIRNHIKILSEKEYDTLAQIKSPEFVLLFMPIEGAFSVAIQHEPSLFQEAWEKKIVIVTPTTLLATLRTVASVWRHERQNMNAAEVFRRAQLLYEKFYSFTQELEKINEHLDKAKKAYDNAINKLKNEQGNVFRQFEMLKELGIKTQKQLPSHLTNNEA